MGGDFTKNPFDDASGHEFLQWFASKGGLPSRVLSGVSAAGTDLDHATQLSTGTCLVDAGTANQGVKLPNVAIGELIGVINTLGVTIKVYPPTSAGIIGYGGTPGAAASLLTHTGAYFLRTSETQWVKIAIS